jgi:signal transduction histidine kinase
MSVALAEAGPVGGGPSRLVRLRAGAGLTCLMTGVAAAIAAGGLGDDPAGVAMARALSVAIPCLAGLYAWYWHQSERFGLALLVAGAAEFVTAFAESSDPVLYTVGRVGGWAVEFLVVYLVLVFPSGRLQGGADRLLVAAMGIAVMVGFLPRLLLAEHLPVPSGWTSCTSDCPANPFYALSAPVPAADAMLRWLGPGLVVLVTMGVVVRLWGRVLVATPLERRMFTPVLAISIARVALLGAALAVREIDPTAAGLRVVTWLLALAVPALALAFLVGLVRWRLFAAHAILRLANCLPAADGEGLRRAFAEALRDPDVEILFATDAGRWCDARGEVVAEPGPGSGRMLSPVSDGDRVVAAIVHDAALAQDPTLIRAGTAVAGTALGSRRLTAEARTAMREVRRSRARIAATADRERRRIERDLHDGAQQRLVALRIELELAEDLIRRDPARGASRLQELERHLDEAIDELRALAHGLYPPVLADRGLEVALRDVAARSAIPATVAAHAIGRYPPEVESAVYFCVLEALQNVQKHATGARRVEVRLADAGGELSVAVRDDGTGAPASRLREGRGIANMRERLASVGGSLETGPAAPTGTVVQGRVPAPRHDPLSE